MRRGRERRAGAGGGGAVVGVGELSWMVGESERFCCQRVYVASGSVGVCKSYQVRMLYFAIAAAAVGLIKVS